MPKPTRPNVSSDSDSDDGYYEEKIRREEIITRRRVPFNELESERRKAPSKKAARGKGGVDDAHGGADGSNAMNHRDKSIRQSRQPRASTLESRRAQPPRSSQRDRSPVSATPTPDRRARRSSDTRMAAASASQPPPSHSTRRAEGSPTHPSPAKSARRRQPYQLQRRPDQRQPESRSAQRPYVEEDYRTPDRDDYERERAARTRARERNHRAGTAAPHVKTEKKKKDKNALLISPSPSRQLHQPQERRRERRPEGSSKSAPPPPSSSSRRRRPSPDGERHRRHRDDQSRRGAAPRDAGSRSGHPRHQERSRRRAASSSSLSSLSSSSSSSSSLSSTSSYDYPDYSRHGRRQPNKRDDEKRTRKEKTINGKRGSYGQDDRRPRSATPTPKRRQNQRRKGDHRTRSLADDFSRSASESSRRSAAASETVANFRVRVYRVDGVLAEMERSDSGFDHTDAQSLAQQQYRHNLRTFIAVHTTEERGRTGTVTGDLNPTFNDEFLFHSSQPDTDALICTFVAKADQRSSASSHHGGSRSRSRPPGRDKKIAECVLSLQNLVWGEEKLFWAPMVRRAGTPDAYEQGAVLVSIYSDNYGLEAPLPEEEEAAFEEEARQILTESAPEELHRLDWYVGEFLPDGLDDGLDAMCNYIDETRLADAEARGDEEAVQELRAAIASAALDKYKREKQLEQQQQQQQRGGGGNGTDASRNEKSGTAAASRSRTKPVEVQVTVQRAEDLTGPNAPRTCYAVVRTDEGTATAATHETGDAVYQDGAAEFGDRFRLSLHGPEPQFTVELRSAEDDRVLGEAVAALTNVRAGKNKDVRLLLIRGAQTGDAVCAGTLTLTLRTKSYDSPIRMSHGTEEHLRQRLLAFLWANLRDEVHALDTYVSKVDQEDLFMRELSRTLGPEPAPPGTLTINVDTIRDTSGGAAGGAYFVRVISGPASYRTPAAQMRRGGGSAELRLNALLNVAVYDPETSPVELVLLRDDAGAEEEVGRCSFGVARLVKRQEQSRTLRLVAHATTDGASFSGAEVDVTMVPQDFGTAAAAGSRRGAEGSGGAAGARAENTRRLEDATQLADPRNLHRATFEADRMSDRELQRAADDAEREGRRRAQQNGRRTKSAERGAGRRGNRSRNNSRSRTRAAPLTVRLLGLRDYRGGPQCSVSAEINGSRILQTKVMRGANRVTISAAERGEATARVTDPSESEIIFTLKEHGSAAAGGRGGSASAPRSSPPRNNQQQQQQPQQQETAVVRVDEAEAKRRIRSNRMPTAPPKSARPSNARGDDTHTSAPNNDAYSTNNGRNRTNNYTADGDAVAVLEVEVECDAFTGDGGGGGDDDYSEDRYSSDAYGRDVDVDADDSTAANSSFGNPRGRNSSPHRGGRNNNTTTTSAANTTRDRSRNDRSRNSGGAGSARQSPRRDGGKNRSSATAAGSSSSPSARPKTVLDDVTLLLQKYLPRDVPQAQRMINDCRNPSRAHAELRDRICGSGHRTLYLTVEGVELEDPELRRQEESGSIAVGASAGGDSGVACRLSGIDPNTLTRYGGYSVIRLDIDARGDAAEEGLVVSLLEVPGNGGNGNGGGGASYLDDRETSMQRQQGDQSTVTAGRQRRGSVGGAIYPKNHLQSYLSNSAQGNQAQGAQQQQQRQGGANGRDSRGWNNNNNNNSRGDNANVTTTVIAQNVSDGVKLASARLSLRALLTDVLYAPGESFQAELVLEGAPVAPTRISTSASDAAVRECVRKNLQYVAGTVTLRLSYPHGEDPNRDGGSAALPRALALPTSVTDSLAASDCAYIAHFHQRVCSYLRHYAPGELRDAHYRLYERDVALGDWALSLPAWLEALQRRIGGPEVGPVPPTPQLDFDPVVRDAQKRLRAAHHRQSASGMAGQDQSRQSNRKSNGSRSYY